MNDTDGQDRYFSPKEEEERVRLRRKKEMTMTTMMIMGKGGRGGRKVFLFCWWCTCVGGKKRFPLGETPLFHHGI